MSEPHEQSEGDARWRAVTTVLRRCEKTPSHEGGCCAHNVCMSVTSIELVLPGAASAGVVVGARIAVAHWRHEKLAVCKATLTEVVETLLARGEMHRFVPLLPPGPRWAPLALTLGWLSAPRYFTVVVLRHDGGFVRRTERNRNSLASMGRPAACRPDRIGGVARLGEAGHRVVGRAVR